MGGLIRTPKITTPGVAAAPSGAVPPQQAATVPAGAAKPAVPDAPAIRAVRKSLLGE